jgi:hypothetical protein
MNGLNNTESAKLCLVGSLDPNLMYGKVVLCEHGSNDMVAKGVVVLVAKGVGMILANIEIDGKGFIANSHVLRAITIGNDGGKVIL